MNLERQRQILKEKHGADIFTFCTQLIVNEPHPRQRSPRYSCWTLAHDPQYAHVWSPAGVRGFRPRTLHSLVAAVTYAKAELARIERLAAAKENQ